MTASHVYASDVAFTPTVKAIQTRKGSRQAYARSEERGWNEEITPDLAAFIAAQTSVFFATANAEGQPYIQHRGGPAGFLQVLDSRTIGFADFSGNRQFISQREQLRIWDRACRLYFKDRSLEALLPSEERREILAAYREHRVNRKAEDALLLVAELQRCAVQSNPLPAEPQPSFFSRHILPGMLE